MSRYSKYDDLLKQARGSAKYWIPQLCHALKEENSNLSNEDIRDRVMKDCISTWQKDTIRDALPDEYKDKLRSELGKKGRQKQLEQSNGTLITEILPDSNRTKDDSDSSTEQESHTFDRPSPEKMVSQLQSQLSNTKQELEDAKKRITTLQEQQNTEGVPGMNNEGVGLVRADKVTEISETDKKGCAVFAERFGEAIRRRLASVGKASIKFFILDKDRSTKIEYLLPVNFTVDMENKSTEMILDEGRFWRISKPASTL